MELVNVDEIDFSKEHEMMGAGTYVPGICSSHTAKLVSGSRRISGYQLIEWARQARQEAKFLVEAADNMERIALGAK
jgi:hypothetical protein